MEGISSNLKLIIFVKHQLECGESARSALKLYLKSNHDDVCNNLCHKLLISSLNRDKVDLEISLSNERRVIYQLLERALRGEPVLTQLNELEQEVIERNKIELEEYSALLPIKSLIPLLFFQLSALLILLFGPLLRQLIESL